MPDSTFLLIPGAGGSAWYWHLVAARLEQQGYGAHAIPLPGADDTAGLPEYADTVVRASTRYQSGRIILVAHSLAGFTVPLVCRQLAVNLVVLVNAMIPRPGERPSEWWTNTKHAQAREEQKRRDGRAPNAPFDLSIDFFHDVPRSVVAQALARGEQRQSATAFASPCTFDRWPPVPTRVLVSRDDRFFPVAFQHQVARTRLGLTADEMPGGHLVALSQPDEFAARLVAYAVQAGAARPPCERAGSAPPPAPAGQDRVHR